MAKIIWPGGAQVSGSTGATTYQRNGIQRRRSNPTNPQSAAQTVIRGQLSANAALWRTITQEERAGWSARAALLPRVDRLGNTFFLSGFQEFVANNTLSQAWGYTWSSEPPAVADTWPIIGTVSAGAAVDTETPAEDLILLQSVVNINGQANAQLLVEATPPLPPGITFVRPRYRKLLKTATLTSGSLSFVLTAAYSALFGDDWISRVGWNIWFRLTTYALRNTQPVQEVKGIIADVTPP